MRLWDFAVAIHGQPGVDAGLLDLQDDHGQCVSYLLWAVWAARHGRPVDAEMIQAAASLARDWEADVARPLRSARRTLKRAWPPMPDARKERLRNKVKAVELAAERTLLETLEAMTPNPRGTGDGDLEARLGAAMRAWPKPAPLRVLATLLPIFQSFPI